MNRNQMVRVMMILMMMMMIIIIIAVVIIHFVIIKRCWHNGHYASYKDSIGS